MSVNWKDYSDGSNEISIVELEIFQSLNICSLCDFFFLLFQFNLTFLVLLKTKIAFVVFYYFHSQFKQNNLVFYLELGIVKFSVRITRL